MTVNRKKSGEEKMRAAVKMPGRGRGYIELKIKGHVALADMEVFRRALDRFEREPVRKHYLNLGEAENLCGRAMADIINLRKKLELRGELFDVIDMSGEIEKSLREANMFDDFKPCIVGAFNLFAA